MTVSTDLEAIQHQRAEERHRILRRTIEKMVADEALGVANEHMTGRRNALAEVASDLMVDPCPIEHIHDAVTTAVREHPHPINGKTAPWLMGRTWRVLSIIGEAF